MSEPFATSTGQVEQFAVDFAKRLLWITGRCRPDMNEPNEGGIRAVNLIGDHLDNAMGEYIDQKAILQGHQEFVLILDREAMPGHEAGREAFNLATLIAFARIGARVIHNNAAADSAPEEDANWTTAKFPGDAVRQVFLKKGREIGDIRIQDYRMTLTSERQRAASIRVASFLPGHTVDSPGDTPKTEPDHSTWERDSGEANMRFAMFLEAALAEGWVRFDPKGR